jgi:hypothetical protein
MHVLFGRSWSSREVREHAGYLAQLAGVRLAELSEDRARGMRVAPSRLRIR